MIKTAREWFEELPSPIREMAIDEATKANRHKIYCYSLDQAITYAFNWDRSTQGFYFWQRVCMTEYDKALAQIKSTSELIEIKFIQRNGELICQTKEPRPQKHVPHRHKYSPIKFS